MLGSPANAEIGTDVAYDPKVAKQKLSSWKCPQPRAFRIQAKRHTHIFISLYVHIFTEFKNKCQKFIVTDAYIKKQERFQINHITLHLELEKEE